MADSSKQRAKQIAVGRTMAQTGKRSTPYVTIRNSYTCDRCGFSALEPFGRPSATPQYAVYRSDGSATSAPVAQCNDPRCAPARGDSLPEPTQGQSIARQHVLTDQVPARAGRAAFQHNAGRHVPASISAQSVRLTAPQGYATYSVA